MKTNYPHRSSSFGRPRPSRGIFFVCTVVFVIVWIFHSFFSSIVYVGARPILSLKTYVFGDISFISEFINSQSTLVQENQTLQQQIALDGINLSESQSIIAEDQALKQAIGDRGTTTADALLAANLIHEENGTLANVLEAPGVSPYDTLVVDAGSNQGIQVGDTAQVGNVTVVGLVTQVFPSSSIVMLLSSSNQELQVMIASTTPATAYGRGGGNFVVTLPESAGGNVGDSVTVPLYGGETIGKVLVVEPDDAESVKNLYIAFPFSVETLSMVILYPHQ